MSAPITSHPTLKIAAIGLVVVDVVIVALHVLWGSNVVNLDGEGNLTAWWSQAKLLCTGALFFVIAQLDAQRRSVDVWRSSFGWVGLLFVGLAADESASLHERMARTLVDNGVAGDLMRSLLGGDSDKASYLWVVFAAPVAIAVGTGMLAFVYKHKAELQQLWVLGFGGTFMFGSAMVLEPMGVIGTPKLSSWTAEQVAHYQKLLVYEEGAEMLGADFFLLLAMGWLLLRREAR